MSERRVFFGQRPLPILASLIIVYFAAACAPETAVSPPIFTNVAAAVGLDFQHGAFRWGMSGDPVAMMGGGLCWLDYDQDGWLDLYLVNTYSQDEAGRWESDGGLPTSALYRNDAGQFIDVSQASGTDLALRGNGCVSADLDLDGWPDIYITTERFNMLLWNNGDGTFTEGAELAGADAYGWQSSAVVGDVNRDGWPDIFTAGYVDINNPIIDATMGFPNTHVGRPDLLYLNQGVGASGRAEFREVGTVVGLNSGEEEYGLGALLTDVDRDGDLDLYVANDTNPNHLYENVSWPGGIAADPEGIGFRFSELGAAARVNDNNSGMGVASGDFDADGRFDIFVTNMGAQVHSIYVNQTDGSALLFQDAVNDVGIPDFGVGWTGWGTSWADIDLDSDLDLIVVNGSIPVLDLEADKRMIQVFSNLTVQGQAGQFEDVSAAVGMNNIGPLLGRGSAMADYDNDGDLDIAVNSIAGQVVLLRNDQSGGNWLTVRLDSFHAGAVITAVLPDGRELIRELHAGSSYLSSEDPRCHFGLGSASKVTELRIQWPNGETTTEKNVAANQLVLIHP